MIQTRNLSLALVLAFSVALAGCNEGAEEPIQPVAAPEAPAAAPSERALPETQGPVEPVKSTPVTVAPNALAVGTALEAGKVVAIAPASFSMDDTILAGTPVRGRGAKEAMVFWTFEDGRSIKTESKPVEGDYVQFAFSAADGMKPGKYNVEIDFDLVPVGIVEFEVR